MATRVRITVRNNREAISRLEDIVQRLRDPKDGLIRATNEVAKTEWRENFDREGAKVGGWPQLAEMTENIREYQGFPPAHPILIRYGSLRAVAIDFFANARGEGRTSKGDNYSDETVRGSLQVSGDTATLEVGGSYKVANQWGFANMFGQSTPARPFWYVNSDVKRAARTGLREWVIYDVLED